MLSAATIIHIIVCVLIIVTILMQSGKGAGLGSSLGGAGSQALFGSSGPTSLFTKVTAVCVAIFMVTSLYISYMSSHKDSTSIMDSVPLVTEVPAAASETKPAEPKIGDDGVKVPGPNSSSAEPEKTAKEAGMTATSEDKTAPK